MPATEETILAKILPTIIGGVVTLFGIILGYWLATKQKRTELAETKSNIRILLYKELTENFQYLIDGNINRLSTNIYSAYIQQLYLLNHELVHVVIDAYSEISNYQTSSHSRNDITQLLSTLVNAIVKFRGGRKWLLEIFNEKLLANDEAYIEISKSFRNIIKLEKGALSSINQGLQLKQIDVIRTSIKSLEKLGTIDKEATEQLIRFIEDNEKDLGWEAVRVLNLLGVFNSADDLLVQRILALVNNADSSIRENAVRALEYVDKNENYRIPTSCSTNEKLISSLKYSSRESIINKLLERQGSEIVPQLISALEKLSINDEGYGDYCKNIIKILANIGKPLNTILPVLLDRLHKFKNKYNEHGAICDICRRNSCRIIPVLADMFDNKSLAYRKYIVGFIYFVIDNYCLGEQSALGRKIIEEGAKDEDKDVRDMCIKIINKETKEEKETDEITP